MLNITIQIAINRKDDLEAILPIIMRQKIKNPVYIIENSNSYTMQFETDYNYYEIDTEIVKVFEGYEFQEDLGNGRREIRLSIYRCQLPFSTTDWGRPLNTDSVETTTYLVKKSKKEIIEDVNPSFKVLFGHEVKEYSLYIHEGYDEKKQEKVFFAFRDKNKLEEKADGFLVQKVFSSKDKAFWAGYHIMQEEINNDFNLYQKSLKVKNKKRKS